MLVGSMKLDLAFAERILRIMPKTRVVAQAEREQAL